MPISITYVYDRLYSVFAYKFPKSLVPTDSNVAPVNNTATTVITSAADAAVTFTNRSDCSDDKRDTISIKENIAPINDSENTSAVSVTPPPLTRHRKVVVFSQVLT